MTDNSDASTFASGELLVDSRLAGAVLGLLDDKKFNVVARTVETDHTLQLTRLADLRDVHGPVADVDGLLLEVLRELQSGAAGQMIGRNQLATAHVGIQGAQPLGTKPMRSRSGPVLPEFPDQKVPAGPEGVGEDVQIYVIDVDLASADSAPHLRWPGVGHSRFVASLIRQQAPAAPITVAPVRNLAAGRASMWDTAVAIASAVDAGAQLINLSLGFFAEAGEPPFALAKAVDVASGRALLVAAAGNHGGQVGWVDGHTQHSPCFPAALPAVIAVGALDDGVEDFSPVEAWVDVTAPGVDVLAEYVHGPVQLAEGPTTFAGKAVWSGTSFSTATVTGKLAGHLVTQKTTDPEVALQMLDGDPDVKIRPFSSPSIARLSGGA